jgi:hypothetical protein
VNILSLIPRNKPRVGQSQADVLARVDEDVRTMIGRGRFMGEKLGFGPNFVHAMISRGASGEFGKPGTFEDLGWSHNIKTTVGMDWLHEAMAAVQLGQDFVATSTSATSATKTAAGWTTDAYAGMRVVMPVAAIGTAPVYGNIGTNSATVLTVDQWWTAADGVGTTPSGTNGGQILNGHAPARFMALTTDTGAPAVGDTTLASENTTYGVARALCVAAHTPGATTFTQYKIWTASNTLTALHKAGLFTSGTLASAGILVADTALNADATLANADTLAVTWTWTLPAAG